MKKSVWKFLTILFALFIMTGCVKFNTNLNVKKDKSMDFEVIYAVNKTYFGNQQLLDENAKKELEKNGFSVTEYKENELEGYKLLRKIRNIDKVSSLGNVEYDLGALFDSENSSSGKNIFKVKKGLFKNKYSAKFKFDSSSSSLNEEDEYDFELDDEEDEYDFGLDDEEDEYDFELDDEEDESNSQDLDSMTSSMMASMDLSFNVKLPYSALSNNASKATEESKNLQWKLTTEDISFIEFEFELYNRTNIFLCIGASIILMVIIIIVIITMSKKKSNSKQNENMQNINIVPVQETVNNDVNEVNNQPIQNVEPTSFMNANIADVNEVEENNNL